MKITILGWYGTETIGDRAILLGIMSLIEEKIGSYNIFLGSLFPFYTERTIKEEKLMISKIINSNCEVSIFNSKNINECREYIKKSDIVLMGGGPLMHIDELNIISFCFKYAKKLSKKTGIMGCGIGPFFSNKYKQLLIEIIENSDCIILRDIVSKNYLEDIYKEFRKTLQKNILIDFDPAVKCITSYLKLNNSIEKKKNYIVVNLRKFPEEYAKKKSQVVKINQLLVDFVRNLADRFDDKEIILTPMHYFYIGNDDRDFLNEIAFMINKKNVVVQNIALNTKKTLDLFFNADICFGMRFHSVVFQTLVNGNNFILDYTEPNKGKISGFIEMIDKNSFYDDRYISLQENEYNLFDSINITNQVFRPKMEELNFKQYKLFLDMLIEN